MPWVARKCRLWILFTAIGVTTQLGQDLIGPEQSVPSLPGQP